VEVGHWKVHVGWRSVVQCVLHDRLGRVNLARSIGIAGYGHVRKPPHMAFRKSSGVRFRRIATARTCHSSGCGCLRDFFVLLPPIPRVGSTSLTEGQWAAASEHNVFSRRSALIPTPSPRSPKNRHLEPSSIPPYHNTLPLTAPLHSLLFLVSNQIMGELRYTHGPYQEKDLDLGVRIL
jgi:hypothetical protein